MRRLPAALALLLFVAALGVGATLCGPPRAVAEASEDCCPNHQEPAEEPSDLGCAPVCQTCAVLPARVVVALAAPEDRCAPGDAQSPLSGFLPSVEHVPIARA
jgi:hypothetical protein